MKRGGLGRGLSSLIPGAEDRGLLEVPVSAILPNKRLATAPNHPDGHKAVCGVSATCQVYARQGGLQVSCLGSCHLSGNLAGITVCESAFLTPHP